MKENKIKKWMKKMKKWKWKREKGRKEKGKKEKGKIKENLAAGTARSCKKISRQVVKCCCRSSRPAAMVNSSTKFKMGIKPTSLQFRKSSRSSAESAPTVTYTGWYLSFPKVCTFFSSAKRRTGTNFPAGFLFFMSFYVLKWVV